MAPQQTPTAQLATPPMTFVDWEWENRHQCREANCAVTEEALFPTFCDWTLFPDEEPAAMTPKAASSTIRARNSVTAEGKVPRQSQKKLQQRKTSKRAQKLASRQAEQAKLQDDDEIMLRSSKETELLGLPSPARLYFEPIARTSLAITPYARIPTPPVEEMGEMFAPIEALGEDLRWYQEATGTMREPLIEADEKRR